MTLSELLGQARALTQEASARAGEYAGVVASAKQFILDQFGQPGLIAAHIVVAALIIFIGWRLVKLAFSVVKYLVIPSVALAFVASLVTPWPFATALPVTVTVCSLFLLFKG